MKVQRNNPFINHDGPATRDPLRFMEGLMVLVPWFYILLFRGKRIRRKRDKRKRSRKRNFGKTRLQSKIGARKPGRALELSKYDNTIVRNLPPC